MNKNRRAGILMPISALPEKYGIGTLGKSAYQFVEWLKSAKISVWQTLPLLPTNYGDSPYQACDSHALNPYFIDFDLLKEQGLLMSEEYENVKWQYTDDRVAYGTMFLLKADVLKIAFSRFDQTREDWQEFLKKGEYRDFGIFMALKCMHGHLPWTEWGEFSKYDQEKVDHFARMCERSVNFWQFTQFIFLEQWRNLKAFANSNGIEIMGDMPIYVAYDSVEMWKHGKQLFLLGDDGNPALVAGVPPDAFSDEGQLWGNPVYDWEKMKAEGYSWWKERINYALELFDIVRIDHFRGFDRFYAIPNGAKNAKIGEWMPGPSADLFKGMEHLSIIAEDLGVIDEGVINMMQETGYPGMKVMEFAFDGNADNEHKPSNYVENCVAYTGTHDNQPLKGYIEQLEGYYAKAFDEDLKAECEKINIEYNCESTEDKCKIAVELLFKSKAFLAIVPMQDVLALGDYSRMNLPSTVSESNWSYRFKKQDFSEDIAKWLAKLVEESNR